MKRVALCFFVLSASAGSAAAQDCTALIRQVQSLAEGTASGEALAAYRKAVESCPPTRERASAYLALARFQLARNDFAGASQTIEAARAFIAGTLGADDLAMASNRQLHGIVLVRQGDREGARQAFAEAARIRNARVDAWSEPEGPMGVIVHKQSTVKLPPRAGGLILFRRDVNDDDGTDVAIGYRGAGRAGGVSVTLYVYRPAGEFRAIFDQEKRGITSFNASAVAKGEAAFPIETPSGKIEGRLARYEYAGQGGIIGTRLYLFPLKRDYLKLRVTHRVEDAAAADEQVSALLAAIGWPAQ